MRRITVAVAVLLSLLGRSKREAVLEKNRRETEATFTPSVSQRWQCIGLLLTQEVSDRCVPAETENEYGSFSQVILYVLLNVLVSTGKGEKEVVEEDFVQIA